MESSEVSLNFDKICRVCLTENDEMHSLFSQVSEDDCLEEVNCLYKILMRISSMKIEVDDGFPNLICTMCMNMAHTAFKFQQQCNKSQEILQVCVSQNMKSSENELNESNVNDLCNIDSNQNEQDCEQDEKEFKGKEETQSAVNLESTQQAVKKARVTFNYYVRANGEKVYVCNLCNKVYKYTSSLKIHMRTHTQEKPYVCNVCGKTFKQYSSLTYHHRSHTGEQPYSCKICGKKYKQSGSLTAHMRVHTGQRPFLCSVCGRGFRQSPDLSYHMRTHTKEKPYMCTICGKTMSMQCHLVQHMRTHTGERPFQCSECHKAFPSSTRLKRHAIIHTGLKPYTCEVCTKSFNRRSSLRVHEKIHTDDRQHICPVCSKGFIQAHTLRTHLLSHSSEQLGELKAQC